MHPYSSPQSYHTDKTFKILANAKIFKAFLPA